jgi:hypothetical protein
MVILGYFRNRNTENTNNTLEIIQDRKNTTVNNSGISKFWLWRG